MMILSKLNGIAARIAIAIVLAIVMVILVVIALTAGIAHYNGEHYQIRLSRSDVFAGVPGRNQMPLAAKITLIIRAVAFSPRLARQPLLVALAEPGMQISLDAPPVPGPADSIGDPSLNGIRGLVQMQLDELGLPLSVSVRPGAVHAIPNNSGPPLPDRVLEVVLPDSQRMSITVPGIPAVRYVWLQLLGTLVFVAILVAWWTARQLARPIREFAGAAERLGVDLAAAPLAVRGPQELRTTIVAFNRMQDRLRRFLEDRTQMLAAISHDLRAPLARLRLRAELVADGEQQRKMFDDLEVMNAMIDSTLAFARDDSRQEPRRLVDLGVLVGDVCEDVADAGGKACYSGPRGIDVRCRATLICRAVANLVDNAIKYGHAARVRIISDTDRIVIVIDDDGPGIPPEEQEKVFAPFYRLDAARDPTKAGVGLGLSIARTVAREHGGDVTLKNRDGGGLSALIELPA
jgi:signal transduction histidine kinase